MRARWSESVRRLERDAAIPRALQAQSEDVLDWHRLVHVELGIQAVFQLTSIRSVWSLQGVLSAYPLPSPERNTWTVEQEHMAGVARILLPYYSSTRRWRDDVAWYRSLGSAVRLFDISEDHTVSLNDNAYDALGRTRRLQDVLQGDVPIRQLAQPSAPAGTYTVILPSGNKQAQAPTMKVQITPEWARLVEQGDLLDWIGAGPRKREPIRIPWSDLLSIAERLDHKSPQGWLTRFRNMAYEGFDGEEDLVVEGFHHLVGMVGTGKSTLITLVLIWLAEHGLRATLLASNTSAVMQKVKELTDLGLHAVPVLGRTTVDEQRRRYEKVFGAIVAPSAVSAPWLKYLTPPCPLLAGSQAQDIDPAEQLALVPMGEHPCFDLMSDKKVFTCPFLDVCPQFDLERDLPQANVWVTNLEAFIWRRLRSRQREILFSETVARESDVLILDEIDDLQQRADEIFVAQGALDSINRIEMSLDTTAISRGKENMAVRDNFRRLYRGLAEANQNFNALVANLKRTFWKDGSGRKSSYDFIVWGEFGSVRQLLADDDTELARQIEEAFFEYVRQPFPPSLEMEAEPAERLQQLWALADAVTQDYGDLQRRLLEWIDTWNSEKRESSLHRAAHHLAIALSAARLERLLEDITKILPAAWRELEVDAEVRQPLPRVPQGYDGLLPEVPIGSLMQFQYLPGSEETDGGRLQIVQYAANGRTLLLWFPWLWQAVEGFESAHVLAMSGTSWAPLATPNHVQLNPTGILRSHAYMPKAHVARYVPDERRSMRVSGGGEQAHENLRRLATHLVKPGADGRSELERELARLALDERFSERARIALLVHSYEQTDAVHNIVRRIGGVRKLVRDEDEEAEGSVRRSDLEDLVRDAGLRVLVAPTTAFGRAHNIVGSDGKSIFGSAYILVRPMSVPGEPGNIASALNHFALQYTASQSDLPLADLHHHLRQRAWMLYRQLRHDHYGGYSNLPIEQQKAIHWRLVVEHAQIIGRFVRGGGDAYVYLCDEAYAPTSPTVRGMVEVLHDELHASDPSCAKVAQALYGWLYEGLLEVEGPKWTEDYNA